MNREQNNEQEAVSPVIATILMVAITVVLAGVLYVWASSLAETNTGGSLAFYQFDAEGGIGEVGTGTSDNLARVTMTQGAAINWATVSVQISIDNAAPITCDNPDASGSDCALIEFGDTTDSEWSIGDGVTIVESGQNLCDGTCVIDIKITDVREGRIIDESSTVVQSDGGSSSGGGSTGIACGPAQSISIAGSSTVLPLAEAWAEEFTKACTDVSITVEGGGSSAGAGRVCANSAKGTPVNIGDMSRNWKATETQDGIDSNGQLECGVGDTSITVTQLVVAVDGLSVVAKKGGNADTCINNLGGLTTAQLRWIFSDESDSALNSAGLDMSSVVPNNDNDNTKEWSDLSSDCASVEIPIKYPDADSGTYDYFYDVILDYATDGFRSGTQSADDNVLVNALVADGNAIGYFGYAYYVENQATLSAFGVANDAVKGMGDTSETAVKPTESTVRDGSYQPLSRNLYMNVNNADWDKVDAFLDWAFSNDGQEEVGGVGYVSLNSQQMSTMKSRLAAQGQY